MSATQPMASSLELPLSDLLDAILAGLDTDFPAATARLVDLLSIASISANPAHAGDCRAAAAWLRDDLESMGFTVTIHETPGQPILLAHHAGTGGAGPRLLYYGHYDVQPADPLELWTSPPFTPSMVAGPYGDRVVARGAVDDKGQVMMWIEALRAWHRAAGGPPVPVTILIEGEEEVGSPNLDPFIAAHADALAADAAVISDTGMWDIDTPAITTRLRGLVYAQIDLTGPSRDLHSGLFGGSAQNPIHVLTSILASLRDAAGHITLPGFYDDVQPISAELAAEWAGLGFDEAASLAAIGLNAPAGEAGLPALERLWARPTAEINGIWGGYTGPGSKTVIPSQAHAKISFRLVPNQKPEAIAASLRAYVEANLPEGCAADVQIFGAAPGVAVPDTSPIIAAARVALTDEYQKSALLIGSGGSIPVVESLHRLLGLDSLLMGFGLEDDQIHSPNEKFEMRCFRKGARAHARLLAEISK